ncbi:unnamed protein product [Pylaiella littoralis]
MTSWIEGKVNEFCGRWLEGFTKDNVDVSLLQAKITLSDLHFKTDELRLLSPTFAPSFFYVGKLSIDIPLALNFSRPVKIKVSDVLGVVRVRDHESMTAEHARKCISANVHVKTLLNKLAAELGGGEVEEGTSATSGHISLQAAHNIHKVVLKLEVAVKNAHIRIEEPGRELLNNAGAARGPSVPAVAFGVCLRDLSLGFDERAGVEAGGALVGQGWFGKKFRAMETSLFGNFSRYDAGVDGAVGDLEGDGQSCGERDAPSSVDSREARRDASYGTRGEQTASGESKPSTETLEVTKFARLRGLFVYFCRDEECYSTTDRDEMLRRLREGLKNPPAALPPLLSRCRAALGLRLVISAKEWGKIESMDVRLLTGDINVQLGDDHLGYLLRWSSLFDGYMRTLALSALRPTINSIPRSRSSDGSGRSEKSRYYRALWKHAVEVVLRDLRSYVWQRSEKARQELQSAQAARSEVIGRTWSSEESEYRATRGLLWRTWFAEWVGAARYLSLRQLIHAKLVVETFADESGGIHDRLYEDLELRLEPEPRAHERKADSRSRYGSRDSGGSSSSGASGKQRAGEKEFAKFLMPWQLPQEDVDTAWGLINRKTLRWELRDAGDINVAIDEEREDQAQLNPAVLQALWSIQLQLDAQLPHRTCAFARRMSFLRVGLRTRIDNLWQARAEKQRRLGLGLREPPPAPPSLNFGDSISCAASEAGSVASCDAAREKAPQPVAGTEDGDGDGDGGDGADRVGTLLVHMGQLNGVGGVGLLSLVPKAVATLVLEESSATLEEMDLETNVTEVAKYDQKNERCCWNQTFRLQVELNADYVRDLRRERMERHRRTSTGSSCADTSNNSSLMNSDSRMKDARPVSLRGHSSVSPVKTFGDGHRRTDNIDSTRSQVVEAVPRSSFLLAVSCADKSVFGVTQLGTMTLPGKQLTSVPLKVLEHRCALFSPAAVGRQPRELTIETIFVPPGENVAHAEQELSAIGKRKSLQDKLDMSKPQARTMSKSSSAKNVDQASSLARDTFTKPLRTSFDNVGEREVKVLLLVPTNGSAAGGSSATRDQMHATSSDESRAASNQRSIPTVDTDTPRKVVMSIRAAGVTVATYLNSSAALVRAGRGGGSLQQEVQDTVMTLFDTSAREIEICSEMDVNRGKFFLAVKAATIQLLDKSLLQAASTATSLSSSPIDSAGGGQRRDDDAPRPQLMMVGPVGIEVASARRVASRPSNGNSRPGASLGFPSTPASPMPHSQSSGLDRGRASNDDTRGGRDRRFWDAWGLWSMWDWRGRLKIGAYTAELGKCQELPRLEEVWRHFRFSMPNSALEDTQVLRGGTVSSSGSAQSSVWRLKAGTKSISVDVQMPRQELGAVSLASSLTSYVYVSSSDGESESERGSETCCSPLLHSPSPTLPPPSPAANGERKSPSKIPSRLSREASASFLTAEEGSFTARDGYGIGSRQQAPLEPRRVESPIVVEDKARDRIVPAGSTPRKGEHDPQATTSNAELVLRIQALEGELDALRAAAATAAAAAVSASAASAVASSAPGGKARNADVT